MGVDQKGRRNKTVLVGVSGGSGSGKTYFSKALKSKLNAESEQPICEILYQDSYYIDQSKKFDHDGGTVNFDHPSSLDFDLLADHLADLQMGRSVKVPRYDFVTHSRLSETDEIQPHKVIIVDGILVFHPQNVREAFDELVFFDTPEELRFSRRLFRDTHERGRTPDGVKIQFEKQVKPMHDLFVEPTKAYASHIFQETSEFESGLEIIYQKLLAKLGFQFL